MINWQEMSDKEVIAYARKHGLYGINPGAAQKKAQYFYSVIHKRGLSAKIFRRKQTQRDWDAMSDKELVEFAKENGIHGLNPGTATKKASRFYRIVSERGLGDAIFVRQDRDWESLNDEQLIVFGKEHGLFGKTPTYARKTDPGYYGAVQRRGILSEIFKKSRRGAVDWNSMSNRDLVKFAKQNGLFGLSPHEAQKKYSKFYFTVMCRGMIDIVFKKKMRSWSKMSDAEVIEYGKEHGLYGIRPTDALEIDSSYYNIILKRGLVNKVFKRQVFTLSDISDLLEGNTQAKAVASLASKGLYANEVIRILIKMFPDRFPSYQRLVDDLPKMVPKITAALGSISIDGLIRGIFEDPVPEAIKTDLKGILLRIGIEEYQSDFNKNPRRTVRKLQRLKEKYQNEDVKRIFEQIRDHYQSILSFKIPGYGRLEDRVA